MKLLVEIILTLGLIGAWIVVSMSASNATRTELAGAVSADRAVAVAAPPDGRAATARPG